MIKTLTVTRREYLALFASPVFWVLTAGFLFFIGFVFGIYVASPQGGAEASMGPLLSLIGTVMLFVAPLLSMRLLAEEQRSGTLEILMTTPVNDWQVVVGKWLGAFLAYVTMIAFTLFYVGLMLRMATNGMDGGPLFASYVGILLLGAALLAIGTLTSSVTENQVVAAFLGIMAVMVLWFLPMAADMGGGSAISKVLAYIGISDHYFNFGEGLIDSRDIVYFLSVTAGSLFVAVRTLETRRWR